MKRPALIAAAAALMLGSLAGCVSETPSDPSALSGDEQTVANLALAVDEAQRDKLGQTAEVVDVYEWKDGYAVLIRTDGENNDGEYSNYDAYGYLPDGDEWELEGESWVDDEFDPAGQPAVATCMALADGYEERDACSQIEQ